MATLLRAINQYVGTSGDTKPTSGIPAGSTFYVTDYESTYIYDGSAWKDDYTTTIDFISCHIKKGDGFGITYTVSIGTATAATIMLTTPSSGTARMDDFTIDIEANNAISGTLSETPNGSGGAAVTPINHNRRSADTSDMTVVSAITFTSAGTVMQNFSTGSSGGNPVSDSGGATKLSKTWDLGYETVYLIKLSADNASTRVVINSSWSEH